MRPRPDQQHECAYVTKRNGAYLIALMGDLTDDATPEDLFDVASSLVVAKRLAREGAEAFGYTVVRWTHTSPRAWYLVGTYTPDEVES